MLSQCAASLDNDTIAAIATPPGKGGVAIIRISGPDIRPVAQGILGQLPQPRYATFLSFLEQDDSVIDTGIALYFPAPASYTGEEVLELQGHGGTVVMDMLLRRVLILGARLARPGEFTQRAFLNDKIDLAQAEAVADLIDSTTEQAVRSAQKSLQGVFSKRIHKLVEELIEVRVYVEAAIDFVEEEIDFLSDGAVEARVHVLLTQLENIRHSAGQGCLLRDGMTVVIAGRPNAGKSSLLNALAGREAAIVTEVEGTTRDVIRERIQIDGMPLHIIDTAGLRHSEDRIEQEGIRRAREEIAKADRILLLIDDGFHQDDAELAASFPPDLPVTRIYNKIDLTGTAASIEGTPDGTEIYLSVKTGEGMDLLDAHLKQSVGFEAETDDVFTARRRHIEALDKAHGFIENGLLQLQTARAGELLAEELRQAQRCLSEITGEFTTDDLLGRIFGSFCIGK